MFNAPYSNTWELEDRIRPTRDVLEGIEGRTRVVLGEEREFKEDR
ncbi:hypothetical protein [Stigmatella aurantiaca]|uniref:Uncharacterized protein n=1 Tax=Stigmatella aurantiaca (strain DW4/3-1) TaxID=378806 RepID=Q08T73_STIAD|nr:hypothetical protein [Stigmatella aurantiaca]EAU63694.1 hypothetical protein STIAU_6253 [Stigmatella aurantiaca DW4/3-1]